MSSIGTKTYVYSCCSRTCVIDDRVQYAASRRLPSRLFSSTRRLFGTSYSPTPAPSPLPGSPRTSHSSTASQSSIMSGSTLVGGTELPLRQRRLAEFATILGDIKLAVAVWETLRKDGKSGSVGLLTASDVLYTDVGLGSPAFASRTRA